jgi:hypothetical protein
MARKPTTTTPAGPSAEDMTVPAEITHAVNVIAQAEDVSNEVLNAGIDIGRLESMSFIATVADSASVSIYERVKKTKAWAYLKSATGRNFDSLDEFCTEKLGRSYRRLQELSSNRRLIGQAAFEQAEALGLRQVDYNLMKKLPAPKQAIIRDALEEGASKEELQRALRELASADQREIDDLEAANAEALDEIEARDRLLAEKNERLNSMELEINKHRSGPRNPDEALLALHAEAARACQTAEVELSASLRKTLGEIYDHHEAHGGDSAAAMGGYLDPIVGVINELRELFGLPQHVTDDGVPEWERWNREQEAAPAERATDQAALEA